MNYQTIDDIYDSNAKVRERLKTLLASLTDEQANALPENEKWTVAQIVEHVAIVDLSTMKICAKLLRKAHEAGHSSDGSVVISENFKQKGSEIAGIKVEAPEFVRPTEGKTIPESIAKLDETASALEDLREMFRSVDGTNLKFPHPLFGEISAQEWLSVKGGHELRHLKQIERVLEKINRS